MRRSTLVGFMRHALASGVEGDAAMVVLDGCVLFPEAVALA